MSILRGLVYLCVFASLIPTCSLSATETIASGSTGGGTLSQVLSIPWGNGEGEIGLAPGDVGDYWTIPVSFAVVARTGDIVIADAANSRISKFDTAGRLALSFSLETEARPHSPMDIEVDSHERMIIFDNEKIQVFDAAGRHLEVLRVRGGSVSQSKLFVDVHDGIYLRDPEWIMKFPSEQAQPIVYEPKSVAGYGGALITPSGNIVSFGTGSMDVSDGMRTIQQTQTDIAGRPVGVDGDGNVSIFVRLQQASKHAQTFAIQQLGLDGRSQLSQAVSIESAQYQGRPINTRLWDHQRVHVGLAGDVYFLKPTSLGAEIWKLHAK